jgi:hypothetical protein
MLGSGCMVPPGSKKENLIALVTAAKRYGIYQDGHLAAPESQNHPSPVHSA